MYSIKIFFFLFKIKGSLSTNFIANFNFEEIFETLLISLSLLFQKMELNSQRLIKFLENKSKVHSQGFQVFLGDQHFGFQFIFKEGSNFLKYRIRDVL